MMRQITVDQRRARLARRHHLAPAGGTDNPVDVARGLVALHATDAATVHLAVAARLAEPTVAAVEQALYDDRTLLRILGMRRTVFVVPRETAPVIQAACTDAVAALNRRRLYQLLVDSGITGQPDAWLAEARDATLAALADLKEATGTELAAAVPAFRTRVGMADGKPYGATVNLTSQILFQIASEGYIVRGRPRGTWISSQHRWSLATDWLPDGLDTWSAPAARTELARQWLYAYGPAPLTDLRWWAGWTARDTRAAVAGLDVTEVELPEGRTGLVLADDTDPVPDPGPWVALLPALDPTVMGWLDREWFLGPHAGALFDRTGNAGPTVWVDGRVVGGWAQGPNGQVRYRLLESVGRSATARIGKAAAALTDWLGPVRVTPRFRTPLERELST
jgi:DNA glycosylase AlkZ-like